MSIYSDPVNKILVDYPWDGTVNNPSTFNGPVTFNSTLRVNGTTNFDSKVIYNANGYFTAPVGFGTGLLNTSEITIQPQYAAVGSMRKHISMNSLDGVERFAIGLQTANPYDWSVCNAAGGDLLDLSVAGNLTFNQYTPNGANNTAMLQYYEYTGNLTFQGPWAAGANPVATVQIVKCGKDCVFSLPLFVATGNNTSSAINLTTSIPGGLRPSNNLNFTLSVSQGPLGSLTTTWVNCSITTIGQMSIYSDLNTGSFMQASPNVIQVNSTSFSYTTP